MRPLAPLLLLALPALAATPSAPSPSADPRQALADAASAVYQQDVARYDAGAATAEDVHLWSVRWYEAQRDAGVPNAAAAHLDRMTKLADVVAKHVDGGLAPSSDRDAARYYVAEAQIWAR